MQSSENNFIFQSKPSSEILTPERFFKCLSDSNRLTCVLLIAKKQELCVCELMDKLALSQPKISRYLTDLRKCNIVISERRGQWVYYQLHPNLPTFAHQIINLLNTQTSEI